MDGFSLPPLVFVLLLRATQMDDDLLLEGDGENAYPSAMSSPRFNIKEKGYRCLSR
jgi:hypothetical protein